MIIVFYLLAVFLFGSMLYEFSLWRKRKKHFTPSHPVSKEEFWENHHGDFEEFADQAQKVPKRLPFHLYIIWSFAVGIGVTTLILLLLIGACQLGMVDLM